MNFKGGLNYFFLLPTCCRLPGTCCRLAADPLPTCCRLAGDLLGDLLADLLGDLLTTSCRPAGDLLPTCCRLHGEMDRANFHFLGGLKFRQISKDPPTESEKELFPKGRRQRRGSVWTVEGEGEGGGGKS